MPDLYHLGIDEADVPALAVMVEHGLASHPFLSGLSDCSEAGAKREFRSVLGVFNDSPVLITDAGIGAPSAAIGLEELLRAGARRVIWVGRRRDPRGESGGVSVPVGAIRSDGTSAHYAPMAYPALPNFALSARLRVALGSKPTRGLVETIDVLSDRPDRPQDFCSAALFVVGASHGGEVASVLVGQDSDGLADSDAIGTLSALTSDLDALS